MTVAQTIIAQLGSNRFIAMTGARNFTSLEGKGVSFRIPRARQGITHVAIYLEPSDTYRVKFFKQARKPSYAMTVIKEVDDVYADSLQGIFTEATGLDTHL